MTDQLKYNLQYVGVTGATDTPSYPTSKATKHQITVDGVAGNYTITAKAVGSSSYKAVTNGTVDGATGQTVIVEGVLESLRISPPNGSAYTLSVSGFGG